MIDGSAPHRATIAEVARLAKVSTATAGRALGGYGYASEAVRQRVQEAAKALGYRPNHLARGLITGRRRMLGVLGFDLREPFYVSVLLGVTEVAQRAGFTVIVAGEGEGPAGEAAAIRRMMSELVDGLIVAPRLLDRNSALGPVLGEGVPVVLVDRLVEGLAADSVTIDNSAAAEECVAAMIAAGHRRIGILLTLAPASRAPLRAVLRAGALDAPPEAIRRSNGWQRLEGYYAAHRAAGLAVDPALVQAVGQPVAEAARRAAHMLLSGAMPPTALFACTGPIASGALSAAFDLGLSLPADLSLAAFDDRDWMAFVRPRITAVAQPETEIGRAAATRLLARIDGARGDSLHQKLSARLVMRGSIAAPRGTAGG